MRCGGVRHRSRRASGGAQEDSTSVREDTQRCCMGQKSAPGYWRGAVRVRKGDQRGMRGAM